MRIKLLDYLSRGQENAKTAAELQSLLGYHTKRDVTKEIHKLRKAGEVICSSTHEPFGYFLPENNSDVLRFKRQMLSRIKQIAIAVRSAEKLLREFEK